MRLSRRSLLAGTGGLAGLAVLGRDAAGQQTASNASVDAVVIGAGLSGLIAARELLKKGKTVAVLEAKGRIGGRMINHGTCTCCLANHSPTRSGSGLEKMNLQANFAQLMSGC